jgi:hypothetical protein
MKNKIPKDLMEAMRPVCYFFTLGEKIKGACVALKLRFFPRKILVAGPFTGEFGHELMDWQAWVRGLKPRYEEVHVITYPGRDFLYPGCKVHYHDIPLSNAGYRFGRFGPNKLEAMARAHAARLGLKDYDILTALALCTRYHRRYFLPAKFELLGKAPEGGPHWDVAFHFRALKKEGPDQSRNYPQESCDHVAASCRKRGYSICCIGHPQYSYCPPGVKDLRSEDLATSVAAISSARLLAGELSGPSHLAQLCGVPILIWAPDQWRIDNCHRWNVFAVPTFIVANDTGNPAPEHVCQVIEQAMAKLNKPA